MLLEGIGPRRQLGQHLSDLLSLVLDLDQLVLLGHGRGAEFLARYLDLLIVLEHGVEVNRSDHRRDRSGGSRRRGAGRPTDPGVGLLAQRRTYQECNPERTESNCRDRTRGNDHRYNSFSTVGGRWLNRLPWVESVNAPGSVRGTCASPATTEKGRSLRRSRIGKGDPCSRDSA